MSQHAPDSLLCQQCPYHPSQRVNSASESVEVQPNSAQQLKQAIALVQSESDRLNITQHNEFYLGLKRIAQRACI